MALHDKNNIDYTWYTFLKGDEGAFTRIYNQYAGNLFLFGKKFSTDAQIVDDAVQEVFVELYMKRETLGENIQNLKAYLFVALKNNLLKRSIKEKKIPVLSMESFSNLDFNIEYDIQETLINSEIKSEASERLSSAIEQLSKKQKEIIYLKFEEELDYPEIAKILQISIESARKQIYRAIKTLRQSIELQEIKILLSIFFKRN